MAAGIIFGPNTPGISLIDHPEDVELLAALGLVLLLFHLGLEFSLDDLATGGRQLVVAGSDVPLALNLGGGLGSGSCSVGGTREALVIAGAVGISSSAIVTKLLVELRRLANPETRLILGIVVVEDLFLCASTSLNSSRCCRAALVSARSETSQSRSFSWAPVTASSLLGRAQPPSGGSSRVRTTSCSPSGSSGS